MFQFLQKASAQTGAKLTIVLFIAGLSYLVLVGSAHALTAPSGLATSTITTTAITVTWTETADSENLFEFGKSTDGTTFTTTSLASGGTYTGATSTVFSSLTANTTYWFRIGAGNGSATSSLAAIGPTYTLTTTPTAPTVGTPTVSTLPVTVADDGATTYAVRVASTTWTGFLQPTGVLGASAYWLTYAQAGGGSATTTSGLVANTQYTVGVTGRNGQLTQTSTTTASAVYTLTTTPTTPTVGTPTVSSLPLTLVDSGATTYSVKVASSSWAGYLQANGALGASQAWLSYAGTTEDNVTSTTGLVVNTSYIVTLAGKNGDGVVASSTPATAKYTATNIPSSFSATASAAGFALTWSGDGTKYYVENITAGTNSGLISVANYSFTGSFNCNQPYSFRVRGQNGDETNSDWSSSASSLISCGGGSGGSVASPSATITPVTPSVTPAAPVTPTVPAVPLVEQPVAPVATPGVETLSAVPLAEVQPISISNLESKVAISNVPAVSFQPGAKLQYTYQYQNDAAKKVTVKVVRQLINSAGKVVKSTTASKTLKVGAVLKTNVSETVAKILVPGDYTVKVKVLDNKNKVLDENSFPITVEKLKQKMFIMGEITSNFSDITFDEKMLAKVKSDAVLPVILKLKYSYTNSTEAKQTVKMTRQLLNSDGKVLDVKIGRWVMKVGETDSAAFTQPVAGNLSVGNYVIRVAALDWKTKEVLAENSVGFSVELK